MIFNKLTGRENGNGKIEWSKVWKLTKMAAKMYLGTDLVSPHRPRLF